MRPQLKHALLAFGAGVVTVMIWNGTGSVVVGQSLPYKAARTPDGHPDLGGYWQALNTANWDIEGSSAQAGPYANLLGAYTAQPPGLGVVEGGAIPYKPEALALKKKRFENRLKHDPLFGSGPSGDEEDLSDPEAKCFGGGGLVRATYMPYPSQIIQAKNQIFIAYQFGVAFRVIHLLDRGGDLWDAIDDYTLDNDRWMGRSAGRWDGDTLVVYTKGPYYRSVTLDRAGNFMSPNALLIERYTPTSPYHLTYEATIDDPATFTRPWKLGMPLYRIVDQPDMELLEFECIPFVEEFMYGTLKKK